MLAVAMIRKGWELVLAVLPRRVLGRLDAWARDAAGRRAERRMRLVSRR